MCVPRLAIALACVAWSSGRACATPPRPDHVVIVIEENHSFVAVIGSPNAPYINQLAQQGALLTSMYALTHPSEPNYLEFFSGFNHGITDDSQPTDTPFATPNLGASLIAAGATFAGFSDGLAAQGDLTWSSGAYVRRHVPWASWQANTPAANQLAPSANKPFTAFPTDFTLLPDVSIVIPDNNHNMHDGTIAQADSWLQTNLGAYAAWATTHNSLLVITWDEDGSDTRNRIPTILYGPMVTPGTYDTVWTLHNLHKTIADMFGASASRSAADVQPISGMWPGDGMRRSVRFRQGASGYTGCHDTYIEQATPAAAHGSDAKLVADGSPVSQGLIRFDDVFGTGTGHVPAAAAIVSARVLILTGDVSSDNSSTRLELHRMLAPWSEASTWTSLGSGVSADNIECAAGYDFDLTPSAVNTWVTFDVTDSLAAWAAAPDPNAANLGWAILPAGTDGWRYLSAEAALVNDRPLLEVTYRVPCPADFDQNGVINVPDIFAFLNAWFDGDPRTDVDGVNGLQVADIFAFLNTWFAGC